MSSLRKFELGAFTQETEATSSPQFSSNQNSALQTPAAASATNFDASAAATASSMMSASQTPRGQDGMIIPPSSSSTTNAFQQQQSQQQQAPPPQLRLEGQRPIDRRYLYSSATVRFVGYIHTSEQFVDGKAGGINSDLIDKASARGGQDPCDAIMKLNRVWKERTFVVEPSVKGWTLHILKAKLGGETTVKHSILLSDVETIDIMTSQQPGRKFSVAARTTADTQAKTHFQLDFQSYISMSLGKQHVEITCKNPEAVVRNYTFLMNCLQATAVLTRHFSTLKTAEEKIDKEQVSMHFKAIVGEMTPSASATDFQQQQQQRPPTAPLRFDCTFSLSTKPQEPYVQLRGSATVSTSMFSTTSNNKKPENIKIQGKFRILLHPHNLSPPMTEEGVVFLVQSDEQHMLPVEIRPIPGKSKKVHDNHTLRDAVVAAIDNMIAIGEAMSGPRLAVEALSKSAGKTVSGTNNNANTDRENDQMMLMKSANGNNPASSPGIPSLPGKAQITNSSTNNDQQQQQQQFSPLQSSQQQLAGSPTVSSPQLQQQQRNSNRWNVLNASSRLAFGTGYNNNNNNSPQRSNSPTRYNLRQGNIVEQLEAGARARLEISFLELLRSLCVSAMPSRGSGGNRIYPSFSSPSSTLLSSSPHRLAAQQNTSTANNIIDEQQYQQATNPRFLHHQMQRNGSVPIAMSQLSSSALSPAADTSGRSYKVMMTPQKAQEIMSERRNIANEKGDVHEYFGGATSSSSVSSPPATAALLGNNAWEFKHSATWPLTMPGDDPQDFRLHLARILKHRAGKSLTEGTASSPSSPRR